MKDRTTRRPTPQQREERNTRRAEIRAKAAEKVGELREWRKARAEAVLKASREASVQRNKLSRGVDRVPAHLEAGNPLQRAPRHDEPAEVGVLPYLVGKHRTEIAQPEDLDPRGNYATRRAAGERGKPRRRRRREMPIAEARRLERRRQEWLA